MAKLTKREAANHQAALDILKQDVLTDEDREFVFENFHEGANHINSETGAFFTPLALAYDFALELGFNTGESHRVIDLCAGIGALSYATKVRYPNVELVCVEINPAYVEIGKKLVPDATWICADVMDWQSTVDLGHFRAAISNPPFGRALSFRNKPGQHYTGGEAEYKVLEIAQRIAREAIFLIPQESAGFRYSGVQCFERHDATKYLTFEKQTGIRLDTGMGIDTSCEHYSGWKGVNPRVEIVCVDFADCPYQGEQIALFGAQR